jgi:hypothetical protein
MGVVLGVGFLNREFTIYGACALILLDLAGRQLFTRAALTKYAIAFGTAAGVWILFLTLRQYSSAAGPGTSIADLHSALAANNLMQVAERLCVDVAAMIGGAGRILAVHWPELFGLESQPLTDFGIESGVRQGLRGSAWLLIPIAGLPLMRVAAQAFGARSANRQSGSQVSGAPDPRPGTGFAAYLLVVAGLSILGYLVGRCGVVDFYTMRYELLSVLGAVGMSAWYLTRERSRPLAYAWMACCAAVFAISATAHVRLIAEYATQPPIAAKQELVRALDARGIRFAFADYWTAYYVSFMTRERIVVAATEIPRVKSYERLVDAHRAEAILISRRPCPGGAEVTPAFWACPLNR